MKQKRIGIKLVLCSSMLWCYASYLASAESLVDLSNKMPSTCQIINKFYKPSNQRYPMFFPRDRQIMFPPNFEPVGGAPIIRGGSFYLTKSIDCHQNEVRIFLDSYALIEAPFSKETQVEDYIVVPQIDVWRKKEGMTDWRLSVFFPNVDSSTPGFEIDVSHLTEKSFITSLSVQVPLSECEQQSDLAYCDKQISRSYELRKRRLGCGIEHDVFESAIFLGKNAENQIVSRKELPRKIVVSTHGTNVNVREKLVRRLFDFYGR